ncbi:MAG TPA: hypothetical protein VH373_07915 [Jatrophihabitantaceae bacterium]
MLSLWSHRPPLLPARPPALPPRSGWDGAGLQWTSQSVAPGVTVEVSTPARRRRTGR